MIARVDDARIGRSLRVLRRRRGWRQSDVAAPLRPSPNPRFPRSSGVTSRCSRSGLSGEAFAAVDAGFEGKWLWRAAGIDRLLDEAHAAARRRTARPPCIRSRLGGSDRGDVLRCTASVAPWTFWRRPRGSRTILVVEVKTELTSMTGSVARSMRRPDWHGTVFCRQVRLSAPLRVGDSWWCPDLDSRRRARCVETYVSPQCCPACPRSKTCTNGCGGPPVTWVASCLSQIRAWDCYTPSGLGASGAPGCSDRHARSRVNTPDLDARGARGLIAAPCRNILRQERRQRVP